MKIIWQEIGADDFKATVGDYFLRAEQMDTDNWWWCVYFKDETIGASIFSESAENKEDAFKAAEKCYKEHLRTNLKSKS